MVQAFIGTLPLPPRALSWPGPLLPEYPLPLPCTLKQLPQWIAGRVNAHWLTVNARSISRIGQVVRSGNIEHAMCQSLILMRCHRLVRDVAVVWLSVVALSGLAVECQTQ